jgi:asparagine synthase (glutamine-hydrolysing)
MGASPFCYAVTEHCLAFASEPEALVRLPGVSARVNERMVATIFLPAFENPEDDRSWFRDVRALMPAHHLTVTPRTGPSIRRYWQLEPDREAGQGSLEACLERFGEIFGEAVRCRLRAPGRPALMMSGGLDSASIAAMTHRLLQDGTGGSFEAYSVIDDDPHSSYESRAILSLADSLQLEPHPIGIPSLSGGVSFEDLAEAAWDQAHPVDNMLLLPAMICLAARRNGQSVLLEGASGDVTTKSDRTYAATYLRHGRLLRAWRECVASNRNHVYLRGTHPLRLFRQNLWRAFAPRTLRQRRLRAQRPVYSEMIEGSLIRPEFADRLGLQGLLKQQHENDEIGSLARPGSPQARRYQPYLLWGLSGFGRVAARHGVEVRDPWADSRVVRFFSGLQVEMSVRDGWTKYLPRMCFAPELAPEVCWRNDKDHLGRKVIERVMSGSKELIDGVMASEISCLEDFVDRDSAADVYRQWAAVGGSHAQNSVFELVTMALWIRRLMPL